MFQAKRMLAAVLAVLLVVLAMPVSVFADSATSTEPISGNQNSNAEVQTVGCATGHDYKAVATPPTCTAAGYTVYTCVTCGDSYTETGAAAAGHQMAPATCKAPATCTVCGATEGKALEHTIVFDEEIPPFCEDTGLTAGSHCSVCGEVIIAQECVEALGHDLSYYDAKVPTYTGVGWEAYEECNRCAYTTYVEIPMLETPVITDYEVFLFNLALLEEMAAAYSAEVPGKDPLALVIKYIRTGVDRYNSGSWGIMAGYEDEGFAAYVAAFEDEYNTMIIAEGGTEADMIAVSSLKNLEIVVLPNGEKADLGHMFGTMDITYHNKNSQNHADVGGWSGDLVDLLEFAAASNLSGSLEELVTEVSTNYLGKTPPDGTALPAFNQYDIAGDLDAYYLMNMLTSAEYEYGVLFELCANYFTEELDAATRAAYLLENRFGGVSLRGDVREAVYNAYTSNKMITTLEDTREFGTSNLTDLRKACCYAFADYLCRLAGDYVESTTNPYLTPFNSESSVLAPGITQVIKQATSADGKQMVYYIATADITRDDVHLYANYKDNDPTSWGMQTVLAQAQAAQNKYGDPESDKYIENYNVIAATNGAGFNMSTGEPGGLLVMGGVEYHPINSSGFFGILKDGTAVIGTTEEYNTIYKGQVAEGIAGFGAVLIKDGKIVTKDNSNRASRTAVGITRTGKVVLMVLDGRQEPISCGGSMLEIAQIMLDAGCVNAVNLDGGGSSTFVSKGEGEDELAVVNNPSDGFSRSVSASLMMVSTAPSSTAFDHAILESEYDYMVAGTSQQIVASGVSATGNAAELPEGATWAVSDSRWGTITEDGVFTALRSYGAVDIYLMLGEEIIGSKTMTFANPTRAYYTRDNMDAVYGQKVSLPVMALYENKPIAVNDSDFVFTLSNSKAGIVEGTSFIGNEASGVKTVDIVVSLASDPSVTDSITVSLYNQGEATFDFDQATGGDRQFAWYRVVSNATTHDNKIYEIVDGSQAMTTTYAFAIDMTQIPIPSQLSDLIYMLPGADQEGASAWTFLLQLAERVSALTEVTPTITFSPDVEVDYSDLTIVNEYFELTKTEFDEETNTLKLTLNWIKQTKAIDPAMANPLCILSGIKVTPKADAQWDAKNRLNVVATGKVSYEAYLRASALYSFALKEENQQVYGLYPFVNPDLPSEKGGYFSSVYANIEDSYTLVKSLKNGWINEEGGFAYYVNGVKQTGIQLIDGYYYDLGENGLNVGQTKFTGLFYDAAVSAYRYSKLGELASGWHMIGKDWYYFDTTTKTAVTGTFQYAKDISYEMDVTGKLVKGFWAKTLFGTRYYYGPSCYEKGWQTIDGKEYYFEKSFRMENSYQLLRENMQYNWYYFDENGVCHRDVVVPDGFYTDRNGYAYCKDGKGVTGLTKIDGYYYYFNHMGYAQKGYCAGRLYGDDYKALTGLVEKDGTLYYYVDGVTATYGLFEIDGDYYFSYWGGKILTGKQYAGTTYCDMPKGEYIFGEDGKMLNGVAEKDGELYFYQNGRTATYGLFEVDGDYYYSYWGGKVMTGKQYVGTTYCDLPKGEYVFGEDGKMLQGIVERDGQLYYYVNGVTGTYGLFEIDGDYYYSYWGGKIMTGKQYVGITYCDLPKGEYVFGEDGKMLQGIVERDGQLYYYVNGVTGTYGLFEVDGDYYYSYWGGKVMTGKQYVGTTYCDLPGGEYVFGEDGKMLNGIVEQNGALYYYVNGRTATYGLFEIDGEYYYSYWGGKIMTGKQYVGTTYCDLPKGEYIFGEDGRMLDGIEIVDGVECLYHNGKVASYGLYEHDGAYYAIGAKGTILTGKQYVSYTYCDLPAGKEYTFGEDGKMLDGFVTKADGIYYYVNGNTPAPGLICVDGEYYFVYWGGKLITSQVFYVWETNGLSIRMNYTFDELGRIVG